MNPIKPSATNQGEINLTKELKLAVANLDNGDRVVAIRSFANLLGVKGGGAYWKQKKEAKQGEMLPEFVSANYLQPYITGEVKELLLNTVEYKAISGQAAEGIKASIIPKICDIWIRALRDGKLTPNQRNIAEKAHILLSAFAEVGIAALIDEATGFQKQKNEYQKILEQYIAKEMRPWVKTFDDHFYQELYRLLGWSWDSYRQHKTHPQYVGTLTNRIVYEKLAPGILDKLKEINPKNSKGKRKGKHHQHLSQNEGYVALIKHLASISMLMEQFEDGEWAEALQKINERFPTLRIGAQMAMDLKYGDRDRMEKAITVAAKPSQLVSGKAA